MKLMIRLSALSLVFAGAFASSFTPKTVTMVPGAHSLVVANDLPVPSCTPDQSCGIK